MRLFIIVIPLLVIAILLIGCEMNLGDLPGDIVMSNPNEKDVGSGKGIMVYTPSAGKKESFLDDWYYDDPTYSLDKSRLLVVTTNKETTGYSIVEYDMKNTTLKTLYTSKERCSNVRYVPRNDAISFIQGDKLIVQHITSQEQFCVANMVDGYCWNSDGKRLLYSYKYMVYMYDMETNKSEPLFNGGQPKYSNGDQYISYIVTEDLKNPQSRDVLIIKDNKTGKEWKYKTRGIRSYQFSPDDRFIAIVQESTNWWYIYGQEMRVWDYKNNKIGTLIKHIHDGTVDSFDWR